MKLATLIILIAYSLGCAVARAPKKAYNAMYCNKWSDDHKHCLVYAKKPYECVHTQDGSCTEATK